MEVRRGREEGDAEPGGGAQGQRVILNVQVGSTDGGREEDEGGEEAGWRVEGKQRVEFGYKEGNNN